jgi:hypothetical protein
MRLEQPNNPMFDALHHWFLVLSSRLCEEDKWLRIAWSFWLLVAARILWPAPWVFSAVFLLGFAKECWDSRFGSGFCVFDILANLIGSIFALILVGFLPGALVEA